MNTLKTKSILTEWYSFKKCIPVKKTKNWNYYFKETLFFSHGTTNSCGYSEAKSFTLEERKIDKNGCILLLDVIIGKQNFALVNLYNANMEKNKLNTTDELTEM